MPPLLDLVAPDDPFGTSGTLAQLGLGVPGWALGFATPLAVVWGFDGLDDRPSVRLPRNRVILVVALGTVLLALAPATAVIVVAAGDTGSFDDWTLVTNEIVSGALAAAWLWAGLAAWSAARAHRGAWWVLILTSMLLLQLMPAIYFGIMAPLTELGSTAPSPDITSFVMRIEGLGIAAGEFALVGAFAIVPRLAPGSQPSSSRGTARRAYSADQPGGA